MTFSGEGINKLTQNYHEHVREHIIPRKYRSAKRPIVINTWEAMYFNIDEEVLLKYADKAKKKGLRKDGDSQGAGAGGTALHR